MNRFFAWCALRPPGKSANAACSINQTASMSTMLVLMGGFLQLFLDLDDSWFRFLPLVFSVLLFGLPHGAIDHLILIGLSGRKLNAKTLGAVVCIYLSLSILFAALWWLFPILAAIAFLLMTIYHWGKSDTAFELLHDSESCLNNHPRYRWVHSLFRGLIPIGMPFLFFPGRTHTFLETCVRFFSAELPNMNAIRVMIGIVLFLFIVAEAYCLWHSRGNGQIRLALEGLALLIFFASVPPLIAIGWYFSFWHGLRHVYRLLRYRCDQERIIPLFSQFIRFAVRSAPFTLVSVLLLLIMTGLVPIGNSPDEWVALYLVLISALTFPHVLLVEWMDKRELSE